MESFCACSEQIEILAKPGHREGRRCTAREKSNFEITFFPITKHLKGYTLLKKTGR